MSPAVALVTSAGAAESDDDAPLLVAALDDLGIKAVHELWDDHVVNWSDYDMVVIKSTWDYTDRSDDFLIWAEMVATVTRLRNPLDVVKWNLDKSYLADLEAHGLPIVPTAFLVAGEGPVDEDRIAHRILVIAGSALNVVVKPTISAGSKDTARHRLGELPAAVEHVTDLLMAGRDVMVQPYLDSVDTDGETGLVFFNGEFSHAFRKGPLLADGPANVEGLYAPEEIGARTPSDSELELARAVCEAVADRFGGTPPLYARVDVLKNTDGSIALLELELIEPSYFLVTDPKSPERAADAYRIALEAVQPSA